MIIAIPDDYHDLVRTLACMELLQDHDVRIYGAPAEDELELAMRLKDAEVIVPIRERSRFPRSLIDRLPKLTFISQTGRSAHHIDMEACTARGIPVAAGTHASAQSIVEHTWALILGATRQLCQEVEAMKRGSSRGELASRLQGRTLGVFGLGTIGSGVASIGRAFGMRILIWGRAASRERAQQAGYALAANQRALFAQSDVLSLNVRLNESTGGIVTAADLGAMKPASLLVNVARAELIEPGALVDGLRAGRPGMAAVDVYEEEPVLNGQHPLLELDNALCTHHAAWVEKETYELYFGEAFANIVAWTKGERVHLLNPDVFTRRRGPGKGVTR